MLSNELGVDGCSMFARLFMAAMALLALVGCAASAGRVSVVSGGEPRSYKLVAPPGDDGGPRPLVIALHGWLGTPEQMARMSGLSAAAARFGFAVVYPEGDWRSWGINQSSPRGATDAAFLADVVADVSARIPVDRARITAVGFSNGGFMAQALACSGRVRLAGVAVVASGLAASAAAGCRPGVAVPFLLIEGNRYGDRTYEFRARARKLAIEAGGDAGGGGFLGTDQVRDRLVEAELGCGRWAEAVRFGCWTDQSWRL